MILFQLVAAFFCDPGGILIIVNEWCWREREVTNIGMVSAASYSKVIRHACFGTYDFDGTPDH